MSVQVIKRKVPITEVPATAPLIPDQWRKPFEYIVDRTIRFSAIAPFPGLFLAAVKGNNEALKRVLLASVFAFNEAKRPDCSKELRSVANAVTWLANALCEKLQAEDEAKEREQEREAEQKKAEAEAREVEVREKRAAEAEAAKKAAEESAAAHQQEKFEPSEVQ